MGILDLGGSQRVSAMALESSSGAVRWLLCSLLLVHPTLGLNSLSSHMARQVQRAASVSWSAPPGPRRVFQLDASTESARVDLQADTSRFGRGSMHLSALLKERDVVAYQTGQWWVDGVVVGDDTSVPPTLCYCCIDTLQVVWTHNCEHGVLRGIELIPSVAVDADGTNGTNGTSLQCTNEMVEFGPEQLVARIPVEWLESDLECLTQVPLQPHQWPWTGSMSE